MEVLDEKKLVPNTVAITSLCHNGKHVIFWDFDVDKEPKNLAKIESSLTNIAMLYKLGKIYILETRNGYNAICLDKIDFKKVFNIKNDTAFDDRKHLEGGFVGNSWKIKVPKDENIKKYISFVDVNYKLFSRSNAHRIALNNFFGTNIKKDSIFDDNTNITISAYWCWKQELYGDK